MRELLRVLWYHGVDVVQMEKERDPGVKRKVGGENNNHVQGILKSEKEVDLGRDGGPWKIIVVMLVRRCASLDAMGGE